MLELIKQGQLVITESPDEFTSLHGVNTVFELTTAKKDDGDTENKEKAYTDYN